MDWTWATTLAAVVVGAALSFAAALAVERRRDRAEERRERQRREEELRTDARLFRDQLLGALDEIETALGEDRWPVLSDDLESRWRAHAQGLAKGLPFDEWASLTIAVGRCLELRRRSRDADQRLSDHERDELQDLAEETVIAADALLRASRDR